MARAPGLEALLADVAPGGGLPTESFGPSARAQRFDGCLGGELEIAESPMRVHPDGVPPCWLGKRIDRFPSLSLRLLCERATLVPARQDIHRASGGESFWQLIPGPGRVWREPGDGRWLRAAFAFTLGNEVDSVTYHGLGLLLLPRGAASTRLRYQVSEGGAAYFLPGGLSAWGSAPATWRPGSLPEDAGALAAHREQRDGALRLRPWSDLGDLCQGRAPGSVLRGYGASTTVSCALVAGDEIYATPYRTSFGEHPFLGAVRQGVWSATKSAGAGVALLHLAERYGADVLDLRVADLLPVRCAHDGWNEVRLLHCFDMATGIGDEGRQATPPSIFADYDIDPSGNPAAAARYQRWFTAASRQQRLEAAFSHPRYPWGPGVVARYRDQDFFVLTACMEALVKQREGSGSDLWDLVKAEVFDRIGVRHAPVNRTSEPDGRPGLPLLGGGLFLTLEEVARIAALYQSQGSHGGAQLLHRGQLARATDPRYEGGLPTGLHTADGEIRYSMGLWRLPYRTRAGERLHLCAMRGYGGNLVLLLPNAMSAIRFAHDPPATESRYDPLQLARVAEAIAPW